jgi:hypothetical protein
MRWRGGHRSRCTHSARGRHGGCWLHGGRAATPCRTEANVGHDRGREAGKSAVKAGSFPAVRESVTATNLSRDSERAAQSRWMATCDKQNRRRRCRRPRRRRVHSNGQRTPHVLTLARELNVARFARRGELQVPVRESSRFRREKLSPAIQFVRDLIAGDSAVRPIEGRNTSRVYRVIRAADQQNGT